MGWKEGFVEFQVIVPVTEDQGPLETRASDEDVPRRRRMCGACGNYGGGQRDRDSGE